MHVTSIVPTASLPHERMCELVLSFPCLRSRGALFRNREGRWCARTFVRWAKRNAYSHGELLAARFVLAVWNPSCWRLLGRRFDVMEALGTWDESNRAAFRRWAERPWWA